MSEEGHNKRSLWIAFGAKLLSAASLMFLVAAADPQAADYAADRARVMSDISKIGVSPASASIAAI